MKPIAKTTKRKGFALIVTLSLMILLTVIAVGLLTLSSISLRTSSQGSSLATARANARMALMLAIGELQKTAGPDQRITAPANLVDPTTPTGITGVWKSWRPPLENPDYEAAKTGTNFLGYLMSNPNPGLIADPSQLPTGKKAQQLVGTRSVGTDNPSAEISAPVVEIAPGKSGNGSGNFSYVTLDEGVKSRLDLLPADEATDLGSSIAQAGTPARNGFGSFERLDFLKEDPEKLRESLPKLVSLNQANLGGTTKDAVRSYFHDFTVASASVQSDVANGGLKTDLSVILDGNFGTAVSAPFSSKYLYSDNATPFQGAAMNADVQWSVLANYARLYRRTTSKDNPKDGLRVTMPAGYGLKTISDSAVKRPRYEPNMASLRQPMLMPTVVSVDTIFSLVTHDAHSGRATATYPYMLHLMYLPVITLHNPYNVPLRVTNMQVQFSDIPIGFEFLVNGQPTTTTGMMTLNQLYVSAGGAQKTFNMLLSSSLNTGAEVVMGAGETRIFGTPFKPSTTWQAETSSNGSGTGLLFDWQSNQTAAAFTTPGLIAPSSVGIGFDVDWLAPSNRSAWLTARRNDGVVMLKADDRLQVRYGPKAPATANNSFSITLKMGADRNNSPEIARTQVFYLNDGRLKTIVEEGVSERFPDKRSFPETCPRSTEAPITTMSIYERNTTPISNYAASRPFAVFSVSAKTTMESFTKSRPVADTGIAFQMATCDFTNSASAGSSPLEFAMVPVRNGSSAIESGGLQSGKTSIQAFHFGGHGNLRGSNNATFFEIPMAPLQSIAQLRHANTGSIGSMPYVTYAIGESRAHPAVPSEVAFFKPNASRAVLDRTWLANDQLWDKYFFSTLSTLQGTAYPGSASSTQQDLAETFFDGTRDLPNQRNVAYLPSGKLPADAAADALVTSADTAPYTHSANYLLTAGGFNVNSTSIPAWTSVLAGLTNTDVPLAGGTTETNETRAPFLRVRQPVGGNSLSLRDKLWNHYRTLDENEISQLATEIVAEVRTRGPFLSMSEFVNRRLGGSSDPLTANGALQAAIERTNLNGLMEANSIEIGSGDVANYGWENKNAVSSTTGAGAPGEVSQGDILSAIGSFVSVRSDTFRIRAYGDATNKSGQVLARAWCEATIQRVPDYVDAADLPHAVATAPANIEFGRQFKVVAFRWLAPDEI